LPSLVALAAPRDTEATLAPASPCHCVQVGNLSEGCNGTGAAATRRALGKHVSAAPRPFRGPGPGWGTLVLPGRCRGGVTPLRLTHARGLRSGWMAGGCFDAGENADDGEQERQKCTDDTYSHCSDSFVQRAGADKATPVLADRSWRFPLDEDRGIEAPPPRLKTQDSLRARARFRCRCSPARVPRRSQKPIQDPRSRGPVPGPPPLVRRSRPSECQGGGL
jgi:hypothetical protein